MATVGAIKPLQKEKSQSLNCDGKQTFLFVLSINLRSFFMAPKTSFRLLLFLSAQFNPLIHVCDD